MAKPLVAELGLLGIRNSSFLLRRLLLDICDGTCNNQRWQKSCRLIDLPSTGCEKGPFPCVGPRASGYCCLVLCYWDAETAVRLRLLLVPAERRPFPADRQPARPLPAVKRRRPTLARRRPRPKLRPPQHRLKVRRRKMLFPRRLRRAAKGRHCPAIRTTVIRTRVGRIPTRHQMDGPGVRRRRGP